jgi:hypothetical protein
VVDVLESELQQTANDPRHRAEIHDKNWHWRLIAIVNPRRQSVRHARGTAQFLLKRHSQSRLGPPDHAANMHWRLSRPINVCYRLMLD